MFGGKGNATKRISLQGLTHCIVWVGHCGGHKFIPWLCQARLVCFGKSLVQRVFSFFDILARFDFCGRFVLVQPFHNAAVTGICSGGDVVGRGVPGSKHWLVGVVGG